MNESAIEQQVMVSIQPQLDRADELLDYYLQDAPPEVWLPIAYQFKPKTLSERLRDAGVLDGVFESVRVGFKDLAAATAAAVTGLAPVFETIRRAEEMLRDDLTEVGP